MNEYDHGNLYIGNIKINTQTIKENVMLIYDNTKDVFYGIEVLNHLIDIETNKKINSESKEKILKEIEESTYTYDTFKNNDIPYIDKKSIKLFEKNNIKTR